MSTTSTSKGNKNEPPDPDIFSRSDSSVFTADLSEQPLQSDSDLKDVDQQGSATSTLVASIEGEARLKDKANSAKSWIKTGVAGDRHRSALSQRQHVGSQLTYRRDSEKGISSRNSSRTSQLLANTSQLLAKRGVKPSKKENNEPKEVTTPRRSRPTTSKMPSYPVRPASKRGRKRTPKPRCGLQECRKKLNITNGFPCRCEKVFCAKHRHPETHECTFDYKEEGRRLLELANPIVKVPKLPKKWWKWSKLLKFW